ncbi:unnamed protein product [Meloidogyne enterolobii]|uniref:Uncharacterized protein n=1 Tax=Meloidogyne enterolobii TaxID=390850 RepID=A0ACB0XRZ9_MELEN
MAKRGYIYYIPPMHTIRFLSNNGLYLKGFRTFSFEVKISSIYSKIFSMKQTF